MTIVPTANLRPIGETVNNGLPSTTNDDPTWYKNAVFYEIVTRGFYDSNGDGIGDIQGVIQKLDYLQWLGVDCLWLLPFYKSPLKDGGYDVSDYYSVLPQFGTVDDVRLLADEIHKRGMRLLADMVMNHTSDQHEWFIESSSSRDNPKADWYVWEDDNTKYPGTLILFSGSEDSNWKWHEGRQQYYWHRYYHHQPDLNFDNPEVQQEMLRVSRFWLDVGVDALRLDAIPQLFEREGTDCQGLPETHDFLKYFRSEIEKTHPGRILLAEADGHLDQVAAYFGEGNECQMAFHFPIMPRIYLSLTRQNGSPIREIIENTPPIPDGCQWALFLRNHDELALREVDPDERELMYLRFAPDPEMRINTEPWGNNGIIRRLFPMLGNDRRQAELLNALMFSLPGTPVMYYGDEIGMGDNITLYDRDSVRTPMQWGPGQSGGFTTAKPEDAYLPLVDDAVFGFQKVNVESQLIDSSSYLHWNKKLLEVRKRHQAFGSGEIEFIDVENESIFAFIRRFEDDVVLCVNNLSDKAQHVELNLKSLDGCRLVEQFGEVDFPSVGKDNYQITLTPYGFYWFEAIS